VPEPGARRSIDIRVLKYAAPALLTTLACTQLFLGLNFELTPWKGGGFGMFSTLDTPSNRTVRVYLETHDGELPTELPSWLANRGKHARSFPADFRIRALAAEMAAATWIYKEDESADDSTANPSDSSGIETSDGDQPFPQVEALRPGKDVDDREVVAVDAIRVEVWRILFDAKTNVATGERIAQAVERVPAR
jgi:hypothetical protein